MPTAVAQLLGMEREPAPSPNDAEAGRRSSFKLPAPLITPDELLDRNVWSPMRRNSSIVANGELRSSNSPRTAVPAGSLLAPPASGSPGFSSPKHATPTRFEDPLLAMPSFRRSGGSPILDPSTSSATGGTVTPPLLHSPSFRAGGLSGSSSFSARRSGIDFRRSVPGASAVSSPGEAALLMLAQPGGRATPGRRHSGLTRGNSDFGNVDLLGYTSPFVGSESGGPGLDEDEALEPDLDATAAAAAAAAQFGMRLGASAATAAAGAAAAAAAAGVGKGLPGRRHSAVAFRSPGGMASSTSTTSTTSATSSSRPGGISPASRCHTRASGEVEAEEEEEEDEFMSRLQQNRSSWRERSRSHGAAAALSLGGGAPPASSTQPCEGGLQNQTHAALEQLRCELRSLSMRSMHATATAVAGATPGGGTVLPAGYGSGGGGGGVSGLVGPGLARLSEGQAAAQLSPSRLSVAHHHYSASGAVAGGGSGSGGGAAPDLFPRRLLPPQGGYPEARA